MTLRPRKVKMGRPPIPYDPPEAQEMLDAIKLIYETELDGFKQICETRPLDNKELGSVSEINKSLLLMIKDERAARKEDNIDSMDDAQLEQLAEKAFKQASAKKRHKQKETNEPNDTQSDPKS